MQVVREYLIDDYSKKLSNLKWHLNVNGSMMSENEKSCLISRIDDYQQIVNDLNKLKQ